MACDPAVRGAVIKQKGAPQIEMLLNESTRGQPHLEKHIPSWLRLWIAGQIVDTGPKQLANMVALMTGELPPDASATAKSHSALMTRLAKASK